MRRRIAISVGVVVLIGGVLVSGGCAVVLDQESLYPATQEPPERATNVPYGYEVRDAIFDLEGLGRVHVKRFLAPRSRSLIIYSGSNSSYTSAIPPGLLKLASSAQSDLVVYDYPGRGGSKMQATVDTFTLLGPSLIVALEKAGWINGRPLIAYGVSFGGAQAASMSRLSAVSAIIVEGSSPYLEEIATSAVPWPFRPFVSIEVSPDLYRLDYERYLMDACVPILLVRNELDRVIPKSTVDALSSKLKLNGVAVTTIVAPGGHGTALVDSVSIDRMSAFILSAQASLSMQSGLSFANCWQNRNLRDR